MGKYDKLRYWAEVTARKPHTCQRCGGVIERGDAYWKERIDVVKTSPGLALGELCQRCYQETVSQQSTSRNEPKSKG